MNSYREAFERCVIDVGSITGRLGEIKEVEIDDPHDKSTFAKHMGINYIWLERYKFAQEYFQKYESFGKIKFLKHWFYKTDLYLNNQKNINNSKASLSLRLFLKLIIKYILIDIRNLLKMNQSHLVFLLNTRIVFYHLFFNHNLQNKHQRKRILIDALLEQGFLQMFDNMKCENGIVPSSKSSTYRNSTWSPSDFPWAIQYFDYIKKRDGSHRRAVMKYLGFSTIPTIVVCFEDITQEYVDEYAPYLSENFHLFREHVINLYSKHFK